MNMITAIILFSIAQMTFRISLQEIILMRMTAHRKMKNNLSFKIYILEVDKVEKVARSTSRSLMIMMHKSALREVAIPQIKNKAFIYQGISQIQIG